MGLPTTLDCKLCVRLDQLSRRTHSHIKCHSPILSPDIGAKVLRSLNKASRSEALFRMMCAWNAPRVLSLS